MDYDYENQLRFALQKSRQMEQNSLVEQLRRLESASLQERVRTAMELIRCLRSVRIQNVYDLPDAIPQDEHEAAAYRVALRVVTDYLEPQKS